ALMGWLQRRRDEYEESKYFYYLGCEVLGLPSTVAGLKGSIERADRMRAGRQEHARRAVLLDRLEREQQAPSNRPSRENGYFSRDRGIGAADFFIDKSGHPTAERPHVHVIHNPAENNGAGLIIIQGTAIDGSHFDKHTLPINASGNEVNAIIERIRRKL